MLLEELEIVNTVGTGNLKVEIDLQEVSKSLDLPHVAYKSEQNNLQIRFRQDGPLCIIYRTGKYIIRGGNDRENLYNANDRLINCFSELKLINKDEIEFEESNTVCVGDLGVECDLNEIVLKLGLERAEFEPEQFPGIFYHPDNYGCVVLIFSTGKVVITGLSRDDEINEVFKHTRSTILE